MDQIQIYGKNMNGIGIYTVVENGGNIYTYLEDGNKEIKVELDRPDFDSEIRKGIYAGFIKRHINKVNIILEEEFNCFETLDELEFASCIAYQAISILPSILNQKESVFDSLY